MDMSTDDVISAWSVVEDANDDARCLLRGDRALSNELCRDFGRVVARTPPRLSNWNYRVSAPSVTRKAQRPCDEGGERQRAGTRTPRVHECDRHFGGGPAWRNRARPGRHRSLARSVGGVPSTSLTEAHGPPEGSLASVPWTTRCSHLVIIRAPSSVAPRPESRPNRHPTSCYERDTPARSRLPAHRESPDGAYRREPVPASPQ